MQMPKVYQFCTLHVMKGLGRGLPKESFVEEGVSCSVELERPQKNTEAHNGQADNILGNASIHGIAKKKDKKKQSCS